MEIGRPQNQIICIWLYRKHRKGYNVPLSTKCYCISYYVLNDSFTKHGDDIKINKYKNIAAGDSSKSVHRLAIVISCKGQKVELLSFDIQVVQKKNGI